MNSPWPGWGQQGRALGVHVPSDLAAAGRRRLPWRDVPVAYQARERGHWVRDMDFDEDRSQIRTASGPHHGQPAQPGHHHLVPGRATNIVAALRYNARRPSRPVQTIMNC